MISDDDSLKTLSKKWKGPSYWSPALGRRGAVAQWQFCARLANVSTYRFGKKMLGGDSSVFYLSLIIVRLI